MSRCRSFASHGVVDLLAKLTGGFGPTIFVNHILQLTDTEKFESAQHSVPGTATMEAQHLHSGENLQV